MVCLSPYCMQSHICCITCITVKPNTSSRVTTRNSRHHEVPCCLSCLQVSLSGRERPYKILIIHVRSVSTDDVLKLMYAVTHSDSSSLAMLPRGVGLECTNRRHPISQVFLLYPVNAMSFATLSCHRFVSLPRLLFTSTGNYAAFLG